MDTFKWTNAEIARLIQIIFRPIMVIIGTIGNCLTIYIMRKSSLKHLSTCFYMVVLALADSSKLNLIVFSAYFANILMHKGLKIFQIVNI